MANLVDRELKFFFTSPLLIVLELAPAALLAYIIVYSNLDIFKPIVPLLPAAWVIIVLFSTFFELEIWRKEFLNRGVKLGLYVNTSEYMPLLIHSLVSLILLELKTLIVLTPSIKFLGGEVISSLMYFLLITHGNWLFSLSFGYVFSEEVFRKLASSKAVFLCVIVFSLTTIVFGATVLRNHQSSQSSTSHFLDMFKSDVLFILIVAILILSVALFFSALFVCSLVVRNIRIDDI
ncbi:MAG: hypothetical protein FGF53_04155 [Candidatus Brockarchaeota archaeon]|nr:hypothetical protein [Candidatus Brockarchaeota archaeon]MBO3809611.1 hypothetical protein [Candidatus Brockarchaeota archaeon]